VASYGVTFTFNIQGRRSRDSVFGIAARYRLDSPEIESRGREIFCTHPNGPGFQRRTLEFFQGGGVHLIQLRAERTGI
jgi:hypothetical protein